MRIGFGWGGGDFKKLGMGFGLKKGPIKFDLGFFSKWYVVTYHEGFQLFIWIYLFR